MNRQDFFKRGLLLATGTTGLVNALNAASFLDHTKPLFIPPGSGKIFQLPHLKVTIKASETATGGNYSIFEEITAPGGGTPLHTHEKQWEIIEVLEGRYKIKANDMTQIAEAGSLIIIPPKTPHAYLNVNQTDSKFRFIVSPGLNFEGFIQEMSLFTELPPQKELTRTLKKYGMNLMGPPLDVD